MISSPNLVISEVQKHLSGPMDFFLLMVND